MKKIIKFVGILFVCCLFSCQTIPFLAITQSEQEAMLEKLEELYAEGKPAGTYEVTIEYEEDGKRLQKTITLTITQDSTVVKEGIAIHADPFSLDLNELKTMTHEMWIERANAHAWRTNNLEKLPIINVDTSAIQNKIGEYSLRFSTIEDVSTTVIVQVTKPQSTENTIANIIKYETYYTDDEGNMSFSSTLFWWLFEGVLTIILLLPLLILLGQFSVVNKIFSQVIDLLHPNTQNTQKT